MFSDMEDKHVPPSFQQKVASAMPQFTKSFEVYGVSNPHPGYGTDPNILNVFGHTKYPMWVEKPNGEKVVVNNEEEYNTALGIVKELKQDGPTIEEFIAAGYSPDKYPPKGYASKSSEQEIKAAIAAFKPKMSW
jgi:hypothetical protein